MSITPLPPAPLVSDSTATFNSKAFAFAAALSQFVSDVNAVQPTIDAAVPASMMAIAAANFKGNWSSLSGALSTPASCLHNGNYWILNTNAANVAAETPGVSTKWTLFSLGMASGTTAQRPVSPALGSTFANTTLGYLEWYDPSTSSWKPFSQPAGYTVNYLVVAGGGGGGFYSGGGGGGGGVLAGSVTFTTGTAYTITVGSGGAGGTSTNGTNGSNSSISGIATALGGGGGGRGLGAAGTSGSSGGSGGGSGGDSSIGVVGGSGTGGQGNTGGSTYSAAAGYGGGGGGGAGAVGQNGGSAASGSGGIGYSSSISGTAAFYGGGGGGSLTTNGASAGAGGSGGGGAGGGSPGTSGTANTGGGGGGGGPSGNGGNGGSGIVIIAYAGAQRGTGGTVTSVGGYTIHTFTASGTYNA